MGVLDVGSDEVFDQLNDRMRVFVVEYAADLDGKRAATEAGYKNPVDMSSRLLKNEYIIAAINHLVKPRMEEVGLSAERIQKQLERFVFCNLIPYLDADGCLTCAPSELPEDIQVCIESFEVDRRYDKEGNVVSTKHKVKLISKISALDMAMRFRGMFAPQQLNVGFDWDSFYKLVGNDTPDVIEGKLAEIENKEN